LDTHRIARVLEKAVKDEAQGQGWPVYKNYEIIEEDGETFVVAPVSPPWFIEPDEESVSQKRVRDNSQDVMSLYAPLAVPELVVELAELAEKEITPEDVLDWAEVYGLLGIERYAIVNADNTSACLRWDKGRKESVLRFAEAAGEVRACLRIYEALTSEEEVDLEALLSLVEFLPLAKFLPIKAERFWGKRPGMERARLLRAVGTTVQWLLQGHCFPQMTIYSRGSPSLPTGKFALSWGFENLLGAIWLQMAWLLEAESERVRRCKLPGCLRVIHFESGEPAADPGLRNVRGKYKTRVDREFCKGRGCKQKYHYRKRVGWPGYD
jgi:hypothetical protein